MLRKLWETFLLIAFGCGCALQLIGCDARSTTASEPPAAECNNGHGECKLLRHCPPVQENLDNFTFCDATAYTVCCPKKTPTILKSLTKECDAYRKSVYRSCGDQPFIVGGIKAEPRELPHMALLGVHDNTTGTYQWRCGGTLIHPRFVLSAAHCFHDYPLVNHVRLGELDWGSTTDDARPQDFTVLRYYNHPEYDELSNYHDLAIIELNGTAELNEYVVPACLPDSNGSEYDRFLAAGWGSTKAAAHSEHLLKVQLDRFTYEECKKKVDEDGELDRGIVQRWHTCAGSRIGAQDTCTGDSGGPLFRRHPQYPCMYELFGVTSFGMSCGQPDLPAVYMQVVTYKEWINRYVSGAMIWL